MRVVRTGATITASYSLTDPDGAGANWVGLGTANVDTVMPAANGPRYIGVYGGNGSVRRGLRPVHAGLAQRRRRTGDPHTPRGATAARGWHRTPVNVTLARRR